MFAHHVAIEIMGKEYEPHGFLQHALAFGGTALLFGLAGIGVATVWRRFASRRRAEAARQEIR